MYPSRLASSIQADPLEHHTAQACDAIMSLQTKISVQCFQHVVEFMPSHFYLYSPESLNTMSVSIQPGHGNLKCPKLDWDSHNTCSEPKKPSGWEVKRLQEPKRSPVDFDSSAWHTSFVLRPFEWGKTTKNTLIRGGKWKNPQEEP